MLSLSVLHNSVCLGACRDAASCSCDGIDNGDGGGRCPGGDAGGTVIVKQALPYVRCIGEVSKLSIAAHHRTGYFFRIFSLWLRSFAAHHLVGLFPGLFFGSGLSRSIVLPVVFSGSLWLGSFVALRPASEKPKHLIGVIFATGVLERSLNKVGNLSMLGGGIDRQPSRSIDPDNSARCHCHPSTTVFRRFAPLAFFFRPVSRARSREPARHWGRGS